jgi:hypothetical protein
LEVVVLLRLRAAAALRALLLLCFKPHAAAVAAVARDGASIKDLDQRLLGAMMHCFLWGNTKFAAADHKTPVCVPTMPAALDTGTRSCVCTSNCLFLCMNVCCKLYLECALAGDTRKTE